MTQEIAAAFVLGVSVGMALHRVLIMVFLDSKWLDERHAYIKWLNRKKHRHKK